MGHMTTRCYMAMFDDASLHFLREIGYRMSTLREQQIGWADVKHTIEYQKELNHGDLVEIDSRPVSLSNRTVEYLHELRHSETGALHACMIARTAYFDLKSRTAIALPDDIRECVTRWMEQ